MTRNKETKVKKQHRYVSAWLAELTPGKIRALAHQHKVDGAMQREIETLRTELLLVQEVQRLAGEMKNETIQTE
jgi:hypothetical protein